MISKFRVVAFSVAVAVATLIQTGAVQAQQPTPSESITAAQTAMGFEATDLMTAAITSYSPIMLLGIGFTVAVGLVVAAISYFFRGARKRS